MIRLLVGVTVGWLSVSLLADGMSTIVLPALVSTLTEADRATIVGLTSLVGLGAGALVLPAAGAVSDRLQARLGRMPMIAGGFGLAILGIAVLAPAGDLATIAVGFIVVQIGAAIAQSALQPLIPDLVPVGRHGRAAGAKGFMDLIGAVLGFLLLGGLIGAGRVDLALGAAGVVVGISIFVTLMGARRREGSRVPLAPTAALPPDARREFVIAVIARFLFLLPTFAIGRFVFIYVIARFGLDVDAAAGTVGLALAGLALLTALVALPAGLVVERLGEGKVAAAGGVAGMVGAVMLAVTEGAVPAIAGGVLLAVASAAFAAGNWTALTRLVAGRSSGWHLGLANVATTGAAAAAGAFGVLIDAADRVQLGAGFRALFVCSAVCFLASAIMSRSVMRRTGRAAVVAIEGSSGP
jgi:MFS family permease